MLSRSWLMGDGSRLPATIRNCDKGRASRLGQAVEAFGGFSIEDGGILRIFRIYSAAFCSASSSCSMVIDLLRWFLACVICSLAIRNHM
jgi:hypothetical protein